MRNQNKYPEGTDYLALLRSQELSCEETTNRSLRLQGAKAPKCLVELGTCLSLLDRLATCHYECGGGDHLLERLAGRLMGHGRGALTLLQRGLYDECLMLVRSIAETANLLALFDADHTIIEVWRKSSAREVKEKFQPVHIRLALEKLNAKIPVGQNAYGRLCRSAVHMQPGHMPQDFNLLGVPTTGGHFQSEGFVLCLNELGLNLGLAMLFLAQVIPMPNDRSLLILKATRNLVENVGGLTLEAKELFAEDYKKLRMEARENFSKAKGIDIPST